MAVLYVEGFDEELHQRLRVAAAQTGESMKAVVTRAIGVEVAKIEKDQERRRRS
jgi:plasmid stability protein